MIKKFSTTIITIGFLLITSNAYTKGLNPNSLFWAFFGSPTIMAGYNFKEYKSVELNFAMTGISAFGGGAEYIFKDTALISPKVFFRIPIGGQGIYSDFNFFYVFNDMYSSFGTRPEICLQIFDYLKFSYGYNFIYSNKEYLKMNTHNFNLTLNIYVYGNKNMNQKILKKKSKKRRR